jgi:MoxR-like ATPase
MTNEIKLPECWQNVKDVLDSGVDRIILYGPPGTGKTYAGLNYGDVSRGAYRIICNEDMTAADVTGYMKPMGEGVWKWVDGQAIKAWEGDGFNGGRIVADEIDRAAGDVLSLLLAMFDSPESATWEHPDTGRIVRPKDGFSVVMTTNVEDMRELPTALKDRFPVALRINQPHPSALAVLSPDLRNAASASADADRSRRFSIRAFMEFDKLRKTIEQDRAAKIIFGKHADDIMDAVKVEALA